MIDPSHILLGLGQHKTAGYELGCSEIELAQRLRVFASRGKPDHAEAVARIQAAKALCDPFDVVGFGERVVVEHGLPMRLRSEIVGQRCLAQDADDVLRILPLVVDHAHTEVGLGQPIR